MINEHLRGNMQMGQTGTVGQLSMGQTGTLSGAVVQRRNQQVLYQILLCVMKTALGL